MRQQELKAAKFGAALLSGYKKSKECLNATSSPGSDIPVSEANFDCDLTINGSFINYNKSFSSNFKAHWSIVTSRIQKSVLKSIKNFDFELNFVFDNDKQKDVDITQEVFDEICEIFVQFLYSGRIIFRSERKDSTQTQLLIQILQKLALNAKMDNLVEILNKISRYGHQISKLFLDETLKYDIYNGFIKLKHGKTNHPAALVLKFKNQPNPEDSGLSSDKEIEMLVDPFILSCRSEFFRANLRNLREFSQNYEITLDPTVSVPGGSEIPLKFEDILCVLEFIFGGLDYEIDQINAIPVYLLSNLWLVNESLLKCENIICETMDENSMIFGAELGYTTKSPKILAAASKKIAEYSAKLQKITGEDEEF